VAGPGVDWEVKGRGVTLWSLSCGMLSVGVWNDAALPKNCCIGDMPNRVRSADLYLGTQLLVARSDFIRRDACWMANRLVPGHFQIERMLSSTYPYWEFNSYPVRAADSTDTPLLPDITLSSYADYLDVGSPYWFALLFAAVVGILAAWPWLRWRFSVRMLFIAMTLMAAPLGALTYVLRYVFVTHSY
jgi:hypothetical protein